MVLRVVILGGLQMLLCSEHVVYQKNSQRWCSESNMYGIDETGFFSFIVKVISIRLKT